jgi:predicted acyltransferase
VTFDRQHLASLDVFRGLAVAGMIVVNNPGNWGAVYRPLVHAPWNGWTFADVIFPCFIFITGATMPFAFARRSVHATRTQLLTRIATRVAALIAMGLVLNAADAWVHAHAIRVPGVLQRIALAYLIAAPVVLLTETRTWMLAAATLLAVHTGVLLLIPFAGNPAGTLTPAHNLPGFVDAAVFGRHTFAPTFDPEGLVGTLSAAATMLCGAVAGEWCRTSRDTTRRAGVLAGCGALVLIAALGWATRLPLNKTMWTGSYALASAGFAALMFSACLVLVDVRGWRGWAQPFAWLGVNPLAIYFLSELTRYLLDLVWTRLSASIGTKDALFWRYLVPIVGDAGGPRSSLVFALAVAAVWTAVAGTLYRRGVRIRV